MERCIRLLLLVGLIVSAIGAIGFSVRIILGSVIGVNWYWGGAIGSYAGPLAFALAMYFNELRVRAAKQSGDLG